MNASTRRKYTVGGTKIFDLNDKHNEFNANDLQNNLFNLKQKFGNSFYVKFNDIKLLVELETINHAPYDDVEFYRLAHKIEKRTTSRQPLVIDFIDPTNLELNNNCCLTSVQRTNDYSGKQLVNLCVEICRKLCANKIITGDEATITCDGIKIDLSLLKLIETGKTYYMKLGFDVEKSNANYFLLYIKNKNTIVDLMNSYVDKIHSLTTHNIIEECENTVDLLILAKNENYANNLEIISEFPKIYQTEPQYVKNPIAKVPEIMDFIGRVLDILNKNAEHTFIYEILMKLSKTNCNEYSALIEHFVYNSYVIAYDSKIIKRDYVDAFVSLKGLKSNCLFSYQL